MKSLRLVMLLLTVCASHVVKGGNDDVTLMMPEASVSIVLETYAHLSGRRLEVADEVTAIKRPVRIMIQKKTVVEALKRIEVALISQIGVRIRHLPDGSDSAVKTPPAKS